MGVVDTGTVNRLRHHTTTKHTPSECCRIGRLAGFVRVAPVRRLN